MQLAYGYKIVMVDKGVNQKQSRTGIARYILLYWVCTVPSCKDIKALGDLSIVGL
jgi:hypothetical protein